MVESQLFPQRELSGHDIAQPVAIGFRHPISEVYAAPKPEIREMIRHRYRSNVGNQSISVRIAAFVNGKTLPGRKVVRNLFACRPIAVGKRDIQRYGPQQLLRIFRSIDRRDRERNRPRLMVNHSLDRFPAKQERGRQDRSFVPG